jgi:hypothetical protein
MHIDTAHTLARNNRKNAVRVFTPNELNALANAIITAQHFSESVKADPVTSGLFEHWMVENL